MALLTGMTCWVLSCSLMLWAPRVTLIGLHREQRGSICHRRNGPEASRKEHSLRQGGTGGERILGDGLWG